jgi:hypothetical protein
MSKRALPIVLLAGLLGAGLWSQPCAQGPVAVQVTNLPGAGPRLFLSWAGSGPGSAYTVQSRDTLSGGLWVSVRGEQPWPISAEHWSDLRPADEPARFYRVVTVSAAERGKLVASVLTSYLTTGLLAPLLAGQGIPVVPQYDVSVYKLVYETVDPLGGRTQASGALIVPQVTGQALPLVSYQHGTLTRKSDAPSATLFGETLIGVVLATSGYVAALPDYLGLGDSPGLHPYHHASSEATASVDMLRAARAFCASNNIALNGQLFLCGYSQGGHVTMALHRELEAYHTNQFIITASAPMAGAYDLSGVTTDDVLGGRPQPNPYYFAYLLAAYQDVYRLAPGLADLLAPPYDSTLPPLLDGQHSGGQINAAMPADVRQVLKPEVLAAFQTNPSHPLRIALRDNDLYRWTPRAPVRLYHCSGDQDVIFANAQVAWESFRSRGAQAQLVNPVPGGDHADCALPSLLEAKAWFDSLKR